MIFVMKQGIEPVQNVYLMLVYKRIFPNNLALLYKGSNNYQDIILSFIFIRALDTGSFYGLHLN